MKSNVLVTWTFSLWLLSCIPLTSDKVPDFFTGWVNEIQDKGIRATPRNSRGILYCCRKHCHRHGTFHYAKVLWSCSYMQARVMELMCNCQEQMHSTIESQANFTFLHHFCVLHWTGFWLLFKCLALFLSQHQPGLTLFSLPGQVRLGTLRVVRC